VSHPLFRARTGSSATIRKAYDAGWNASARTEDNDLGRAESRYEKKHTDAELNAFIAGWVDYSADHPKYTNLPATE
jgi:hypothetical protein